MKELPFRDRLEETQHSTDIVFSVDDLLKSLPDGTSSFELKIYMWANEHGKLVKVPISRGDTIRITVIEHLEGGLG